MSPWSRFEPAILETCEPTLGGWVAHPVEAVTSLAYLAVALVLRHRFGRVDGALPARFLPAIFAIIGVTSILFHASYAAIFQIVDIAAIPLLAGYFLAATLVHRRQASVDTFPRLVGIFAGLGAILPLVHVGLGLTVVILQGGAALWLWRGGGAGPASPNARIAVSLLIPATLLLGLDHAAIGCVTGTGAHLVQPHAVWHLGSAASLIFFYRAERLLERQWVRTP